MSAELRALERLRSDDACDAETLAALCRLAAGEATPADIDRLEAKGMIDPGDVEAMAEHSERIVAMQGQGSLPLLPWDAARTRREARNYRRLALERRRGARGHRHPAQRPRQPRARNGLAGGRPRRASRTRARAPARSDPDEPHEPGLARSRGRLGVDRWRP